PCRPRLLVVAQMFFAGPRLQLLGNSLPQFVVLAAVRKVAESPNQREGNSVVVAARQLVQSIQTDGNGCHSWRTKPFQEPRQIGGGRATREQRQDRILQSAVVPETPQHRQRLFIRQFAQ